MIKIAYESNIHTGSPKKHETCKTNWGLSTNILERIKGLVVIKINAWET